MYYIDARSQAKTLHLHAESGAVAKGAVLKEGKDSISLSRRQYDSLQQECGIKSKLPLSHWLERCKVSTLCDA